MDDYSRDMGRREFIIGTSALLTLIGASCASKRNLITTPHPAAQPQPTPAPINQPSGKIFTGFSQIFYNGNHETGVFAEHGAYDSFIFSAYKASSGKEWVMTTKRALDLLVADGWSAVGNGGWFEDYQYDRPSALFVEDGKIQQQIHVGRGDAIITVDLDSRISIQHKSEYNNLMTAAEALNFKSAIQATLLFYKGRNEIGNVAQNVIPRSGIAVGDEGMVYMVLKNCNQDKFVTEIQRVYNEYVKNLPNYTGRLPDVAQLDSEKSASFVMQPSIGKITYTKNIDGRYVGSQLKGIIDVAGTPVDYGKFDLPERAVANFFAFRQK